ncbi:MAG: di-trans,poly-cis-decaprenylcistransferase [Acidobacteriota bacterium]|nr:di-trans,poly-cis-decaprenylcistransferase [Acidobacteriota bacterium]
MQNESSRRIHVAIIMDGNGRWAERRGLPRTAGHRAGIAAVRRVVENALESEIERLTLYAFSSDNWRRPSDEVQRIFWLLRAFLRLETERMRQRGVRLEFIGRRDRLSPHVLQAMEWAEASTYLGNKLIVSVAVDYSSRFAIASAIAQCAGQGTDLHSIQQTLASQLASHSADVDLLIRTGGEKRLSDFLLWESAYAELFFTDTMWPDFTASHLQAALADFRSRHRSFGGVDSRRRTHKRLQPLRSGISFSIPLDRR